MCNKPCYCICQFVPLALLFGQTVHTFQGQNAGKVDAGRPPNPVQCIIWDPGTRAFEDTNIGLFYTILSRATTIGTFNNRRLCSLLLWKKHEPVFHLKYYTTKQWTAIQKCAQTYCLGLTEARRYK